MLCIMMIYYISFLYKYIYLYKPYKLHELEWKHVKDIIEEFPQMLGIVGFTLDSLDTDR